MKRRVVITGIGIKCSVGNRVEEFWNNICASKHGIRRIDSFDINSSEVKLAAVDSDFKPEEYLDRKTLRRTDRFCQFAIAAAEDALQDAGDIKECYDPFRVGVIVSSGIGGFNTIEREYTRYLQKGGSRISVFFVPMMISNMAAGMISIRSGFRGANMDIVTACSSSGNALGEAFHKIRDGYLDACITGGSEAAITEFAINGFNNMTALSRSEDPDRASIPFDKERDGFVMSEGSAILILEELESVKRRKGKIYAEVVGYGATGDAYHITSPAPDGMGAIKSMEFALADAGINSEDVDYLNAHGTSTGPNDRIETLAAKAVFGERVKNLPISSTKSMTGHMLGAAGAAEGAVCALALRDGVIPPTANYRVRDEECDLDYVTDGARKQPIRYALSNSLGFGGHNATICFKKYED